ncbi:MAG: hypothetical protein ACTSSA_15995 [Candidatus Freyarchaeota archaeon]
MRRACLAMGLILLLLTLWGTDARAQSSPIPQKERKTKLEAFQAQSGVVIIKGYSVIGRISGLGSIEVIAMEFTEASNRRKQKGIVVEIKESGKFADSNRSFIDYDEIQSLLKGIDYIASLRADVTDLNQFEATYQTKGNFKVTTFNISESVCPVKSSHPLPL